MSSILITGTKTLTLNNKILTAGVSSTWDNNASILFTNMSAVGETPPDALKTLINTTILAYKSCGYWDLSDVIVRFNTYGANSGLLDWKGNVNAVGVNSPAFTTYLGYQGDFNNTRYINTQWTRNRGGNVYARDNAHFYRDILVTSTVLLAFDGVGTTVTANNAMAANASNALNYSAYVSANDDAAWAGGSNTTNAKRGHNFLSRNVSNANETSVNNNKINGNKNSVAISGTETAYIFGANLTGALVDRHDSRFRGYSFGAYLSDAIKLQVGLINNYFNDNVQQVITGTGVQYPSILYDGNTWGLYDFNQAITITKDGSNYVSKWEDLFCSGHDLLQATAGIQPVWSVDGITFDGTDDFMQTAASTLNQPIMIYLVVQHPTWAISRAIFDGTDDFMQTAASTLNQPIMIYLVVQHPTWAISRAIFDGIGLNFSGGIFTGTPTPNIYASAGSASTNETHLTTGAYHIIRVLFNGASSKLIVDNNTPVTGNFGSNNMGGLTIGKVGFSAAYYDNAIFKEIIVRKIQDATGDETTINNYLKTKYSL